MLNSDSIGIYHPYDKRALSEWIALSYVGKGMHDSQTARPEKEARAQLLPLMQRPQVVAGTLCITKKSMVSAKDGDHAFCSFFGIFPVLNF